MLQYLINATMIWLLSLLIFNLFLSKESYHGYNRLYLLLTLTLGALLPLIQWQQAIPAVSQNNGNVVTTTIIAKQRLVEATSTTAENSMSTLQWLWIVYGAGIVINLLMLLKEIIVLLRYYKTGTRSKDGVWTIIKTGKEHTPFSAFRTIFINSKNQYNPIELRMILTHEEQHGHALHFIDVLLLQLAKVIFWFHPLVYVYQKCLLMLHEYQADAAVDKQPEIYGRFLIEQSMLQSAPVLSHSFNRSPINNRIVMLTRKSSFQAGFKRLFAVPLCICCIFLFTENALSKEPKKEGNKLYYNGNVFELWSPTITPDTVMTQDPVTGKENIMISRVDSFPVKMNGKEIYRYQDLSAAERKAVDDVFDAKVKDAYLQPMKKAMSKMTNGDFSIWGGLIVDEKGTVVFNEQPHIGNRNWNAPTNDSDEATARQVEKELNNIMASSKTFIPVKRGNNAIIFRHEHLFPGKLTFHVKNHEVTITE